MFEYIIHSQLYGNLYNNLGTKYIILKYNRYIVTKELIHIADIMFQDAYSYKGFLVEC